MERKKKIPIGIENFREICTQGFYYIDKTNMIRDLLYNGGKVNLFTRPRRFGKSLNMSMLKTFFEMECEEKLFESLDIMQEKELCEEYMGKFPVISITLKGVSGKNYETAFKMMREVIGNEALRFQILLQSQRLSETEKKRYEALIKVDENGSFTITEEMLTNSLWTLSSLLSKHYGTQIILLIDEYDVPLDKAYQSGYYNEMLFLIRNMFNQALKGNDSLFFSVLTGCLRIAKESIFTGLNNLKIFSVTSVRFDEYFGFTDKEVRDLLAYYDLPEAYPLVKEWYDGYQFGNAGVYCPWDVMNYCDELCADREAKPQEYWINTSSNYIVRKFIHKASKSVQREIERLIEGESVLKKVEQNLTYNELYRSADNLWSLLFATGYLTQSGKAQDGRLPLAIPNREIRQIFVTQIMEWFGEIVRKDTPKLDAFCKAVMKADAKKVEEGLNDYLKRTISIRDTSVQKERKENFYHGILLGLLGHMENWSISSNAESGEGYSDILIEIEEEGIGIVIEVKYAENDRLEAACKKALEQIEKNRYEVALAENEMHTIIKYGIACYKKHCKVIMR